MIDSHYMYRPPTLDAETFAVFIADAENVLRDAQSGVYLAGEDGTGKPELDNYRVAFNGDGSMALDCEPLIIEQTFTGRRRPGEQECLASLKRMEAL